MDFEIAIIGAGMAGASLAAECAAAADAGARILLLEAEDLPGYHTTGRSAAFWEECYGGPEIVPLTLASGTYLRQHGFLSQRGALYIGREQDIPALDAFMERFGPTGVEITRVGGEDLCKRVPGLKPEWCAGIWQPRCSDIDVSGLHQHYLAQGKAKGVRLECRALINSLSRDANGWTLQASNGRQWNAKTLVNAAGAWADDIAVLAGAKPLGIRPYRRTVAQLVTEPSPRPDQPLVLDINGDFYFKPESGRVWLSPHDEVPSAPCDAAPEELAVAQAIDRFEHVVDWRVERIERKWAGLRSFAPDRCPVYGWDSRQEGYFWFAGQGGYGIQTAPAAARLGAQMLLDQPRDAMTLQLDEKLYQPDRFS
ncbi:NAD(P)/FAD-dependent oxidoreductase [Parerythrobacter jejuensis]|uniref:FAD-dependent oxidoreductase n=1 Tax=Parerythrobacter jejuensis TaxID=795812 RepID=A0A845APQ3_9SPHN|nr:FAD-dependent oxidoreductase [Parerythrobacter jejuensis]MXP31594.1 FAD-dependent oxidoreductase [Parerythrobacter jejuensis]